LVAVLEEMGVPYLIGGSVALGVWAKPRTTHDLDVVIDLPIERILEFCAHFPPDRYYIDPLAMIDAFSRAWMPSQGIYSFIDMETGFKIDLFPLRKTDAAQVAALDHRVTEEVLAGQQAAVYTPADLLIQKLRWYAASESSRQFQDCLNLVLSDLVRPSPQIDWPYVTEWAQRLGEPVARAWELLMAAVSAARQTGTAP
jgi:hypothetical protein